MSNRRLRYLIPAVICFSILAVAILITNQDKTKTEAEQNTTSSAVTETPNKNLENREYLLDDFKSNNKDFEVKDYVFGEENAIIYLAIAFYDKEKNTDCNLAIISETGTGYLNIASGWESFSFYSEEKMKIIYNDTLTVSLIDNSTEDIYDYRIKYIVSGSDITYDVDSGKRKTSS